MSLRPYWRVLIDRIAPASCVFCGMRGAADEENICSGCYADLPWMETACTAPAMPFECVVTPLRYDFPIDVAIKALKFKRRLFYAPAFARILCSAGHLLPDDIDAVLPVPLHWRRKTLRGFNQALEIAKPVAKFLDVPIVRAVQRKHATPFQSGLSAKQRAANLRRAFVARRAVSRAHVLIIDDVVTTGATTGSLAKVLLGNGVGRVSLLALARAK